MPHIQSMPFLSARVSPCEEKQHVNGRTEIIKTAKNAVMLSDDGDYICSSETRYVKSAWLLMTWMSVLVPG